MLVSAADTGNTCSHLDLDLGFCFGGRMQLDILAWLALCNTSLVLQVRLRRDSTCCVASVAGPFVFQVRILLAYLRSRPTHLVSLNDLVKSDLVRSLLLAGRFLLLQHLLINLDLLVPSVLASLVVFAHRFSMNIFFLYLSVGVTVQYLHVAFRC